MLSRLRLTRFAISSGMVPRKLFLPTSNPISVLDIFVMIFGKVPPNWLSLKARYSYLVQLVRDLKNLRSWFLFSPKLFLRILNHDKFVRFPKVRGISPLNLLSGTSISWRSDALVNETGSSPLKWLFVKYRSWSFGRSKPILLLRVPVKLLKASNTYLSEDKL